ncbi:MAG: hypothetical protein KF703_03045 [Actinobacteria bacterium]|nr:hypothetical protein [Actinomycetota bacterium]
MADRRPGWGADEGALRVVAVDGYRSPQQHRSVETTRRMLGAAWDAMAAHPAEPLRLEEVLDGADTSASSFYARFDGIDTLVEVAGLLALDHDAVGTPPAYPVGPGAATEAVLASVLARGALPREVLAVGLWSEPFVAAHHRRRTAELRAAAVAVADGGADYGRSASWLHLVAALADQAGAIGRLVVADADLAALAGHVTGLAEVLLEPEATTDGRVAGVVDLDRPTVARPALAGHSDRGAQALGELRAALHRALLAEPRALVPGDVARSVHRSRTAFFDAFGTTGAALADLARTEQVGRVPTELFRPRPDVGPPALVAHLAHRVRAWQDHQGITGRRLLQVAARHPELAAEVVGQVLDSVELLTGWYARCFDLPVPLVRVVFLLVLASEQHQVVWGARPAALTGPDALARLLAPVVAGASG